MLEYTGCNIVIEDDFAGCSYMPSCMHGSLYSLAISVCACMSV